MNHRGVRGKFVRFCGLAGLCILVSATSVAGQGQGRVYAFNAGYTVGTGGSSTAVAPVRLGLVEAGTSFRLWTGDRWEVEYPVTVIPFLMVRETPLAAGVFLDDRWVVDASTPRGTSYGAGLKPLGLQLVRKARHVSIFAGLTSGFVVFDRPTPAANARKLNYVGEVEAGMRIRTGARTELVGVYRWNHISNAGTAELNPGLDSHMIFLGLRVR
ncbi:MAG TPA: acyloxyacyl hydrolase [Longimicrobiales bacterium]|nr:acyloxyacyl hydrolase [Longimicrobiales bacterium]